MEYLKVSGGKGSPKRELRASKNRQQQKTMMSNVMEAISKLNEGGVCASEANENGVVRMKIMVKKQDLKKMIESMHGGDLDHNKLVVNPQLSVSFAEQRLNLLRRKHIVRAANSGKENRRRSWRPELQSIPEEL